MRKLFVLLSFISSLLLQAPCDAKSSLGPSFSKAELSIINRNQTLRSLVKTDPKTVRKALDLMQRNHIGSRSEVPGGDGDLQSRDELTADPDLDELERSNPEAARDLFLLIKRVATEKNKK
ncbi:hypothetical protein [Bradyrhizobium lablabi]|uniref:hypothetical protein n=1 Tax=Bradyrhizobium lablabi TaxID=722472 RepID=UPI001BA7D20C|nr:hypothetical protein [Bradyrhizobium lablabi]MBR0695621.1 hypothetical protein [Bradyrhizobium lablabi]